ncbi:hypothetical protein F9C07_1766396 [Aspergillus flavus]|uniref:Uncharacterized protein n=1 Tax=Aspergillus flavus (strain ATCC 200026 / FGSC A1120 / IAM 13836 / NRRL 3357 / JCM 12722 / SRRC 167) TaxID=332952 RepID=A0A7U2N266_ASPFN|nr:hypothetical protein F9C07_1766396 [Aspergillus flavus]
MDVTQERELIQIYKGPSPGSIPSVEPVIQAEIKIKTKLKAFPPPPPPPPKKKFKIIKNFFSLNSRQTFDPPWQHCAPHFLLSSQFSLAQGSCVVVLHYLIFLFNFFLLLPLVSVRSSKVILPSFGPALVLASPFSIILPFLPFPLFPSLPSLLLLPSPPFLKNSCCFVYPSSSFHFHIPLHFPSPVPCSCRKRRSRFADSSVNNFLCLFYLLVSYFFFLLHLAGVVLIPPVPGFVLRLHAYFSCAVSEQRILYPLL